MDEACSKHGRDEKFTQTLVEKPRRKRTLGRPRSRWENNGV